MTCRLWYPNSPIPGLGETFDIADLIHAKCASGWRFGSTKSTYRGVPSSYANRMFPILDLEECFSVHLYLLPCLAWYDCYQRRGSAESLVE